MSECLVPQGWQPRVSAAGWYWPATARFQVSEASMDDPSVTELYLRPGAVNAVPRPGPLSSTQHLSGNKLKIK